MKSQLDTEGGLTVNVDGRTAWKEKGSIQPGETMNVPTTLEGIESAAREYGPTPAAKQMMRREAEAAQEAIERGLYITWQSNSSTGGQICTRIGSKSRCLCGHFLKNHLPLKRGGSTRPPKCNSCTKCPGFRYAPSRPEECGQWHLPRRKDFDLKAWQMRVSKNPHDYACIGCDSRVSDHTIVIETTEQRMAAGLPVGQDFMPLNESPSLQRVVFGKATSTSLTLEQLVETGAITVEEYRSRIATGQDSCPRIMQQQEAPARSARSSPAGSSMSVAAIPTSGDRVVFTNVGVKPHPVPGKKWMRHRH